MDNKIKEAQDILKGLGMPESQQNRICSLTLLALAGITPDRNWRDATSKSLTLSKDIIEFVNKNYDADYKPNTRESFRKIALKPFVENNIVVLNPDNPDLSLSSSKTHYALSPIAQKAIVTYGTPMWESAIIDFKKNQFPENIPLNILLRKISIKNYKSIIEDTIELGKFNVFIGVNGCGKTNILEAIAMAGASMANDLNFEGLYGRGVRIARPDLTISSFLSTPQKDTIDIDLNFDSDHDIRISLYPENPTDIYAKWRDINHSENSSELVDKIFKTILNEYSFETMSKEDLARLLAQRVEIAIKNKEKINIYKPLLTNYAIFDLNTKSLRGVVPADSRKTPLGINGEGLDLLISSFNSYEKNYLKECSSFFDWLESIYSDKDDKPKIEGLKPGRSSSTLYFTDRYMQKRNNTFSAENSNEGILHILFYVALFVSSKTPNLFAIDNIETALNPRLCQKLVSVLVKLAKERGKQALVTTHNPAILDGLDLSDDEQRLFVVYRNSEGKTKTRRIKFKSDYSDKPFKLSEMWLNGTLGALPKNF